MDKKKVAINALNLTPTLMVSKVKLHLQKITGNTNFPTMDLTVLQNSISELEQAVLNQQSAYTSYLQQSALVKDKMDSMNFSLRNTAMEVELLAQGDENKIRSAGFDIAKDKHHPPIVSLAPQNVSLKEADSSGSLALSFKAVKKAKAYIVQIFYDISDAEAWAQYDVVTTCRLTLAGLTSGKEVWVRVASIGVLGKSDWSDVAKRYVP